MAHAPKNAMEMAPYITVSIGMEFLQKFIPIEKLKGILQNSFFKLVT
jgi:hypothetical protein